MKKPLSPAKVQALIWLGAVVVVALFAAIAWPILTKPPALDAPEPPVVAEPTTDLASRAAAPADELVAPAPVDEPESTPEPEPEPAPTTEPEAPEPSPDPSPVPRPTGLSEEDFVDISAMIVLAGEWAEEAGDGPEALEQAVESILKRRGVDRVEFETMTETVAAEPERRARILDKIATRVTALRVGGVRVSEESVPHAPGRPTDGEWERQD